MNIKIFTLFSFFSVVALTSLAMLLPAARVEKPTANRVIAINPGFAYAQIPVVSGKDISFPLDDSVGCSACDFSETINDMEEYYKEDYGDYTADKGEWGIYFNCDDPTLDYVLHIYSEEEFEGAKFTYEADCQDYYPMYYPDTGFEIKSFDYHIRQPGIYYYQDANCGSNGFSSKYPERTGDIPKEFIDNLQSFKIINDPDKNIYYGAIFNSTAGFAGQCSEPAIVTTATEKSGCFNIPHNFYPRSVAIFGWDGTYENRQNQQQGLSIYGAPQPVGNYYQQYYQSITAQEIVNAASGDNDSVPGRDGYYLYNDETGSLSDFLGAGKTQSSSRSGIPTQETP